MFPLFSFIKGMGGCGECTPTRSAPPTVRYVSMGPWESPPQANVPECTRMYPNVPECTRMYPAFSPECTPLWFRRTVGKLQGNGGVAVAVPERKLFGAPPGNPQRHRSSSLAAATLRAAKGVRRTSVHSCRSDSSSRSAPFMPPRRACSLCKTVASRPSWQGGAVEIAMCLLGNRHARRHRWPNAWSVPASSHTALEPCVQSSIHFDLSLIHI